MTRTLVLVRHAKPEKVAGSGQDFDRELTPEGLAAVQESYPETFKLMGDARPVIWSSPATRALQTAEAVADALDVDPMDIEEHDVLYEQDVEAFLDELAESGEQCVVAVGHVPFVEELPRMVGDLDLDFSAGAACALELPGDTFAPARLLWFVQGPKVEG